MQIDYAGMGIAAVMECTGYYLSTDKCKPYFDAGIKKIIVSAPFKDSGDNIINIVKGCNDVCTLCCCLGLFSCGVLLEISQAIWIAGEPLGCENIAWHV